MMRINLKNINGVIELYFVLVFLLFSSTNVWALSVSFTKLADGEGDMEINYPVDPGYKNPYPLTDDARDALVIAGYPIQGQFFHFTRPVIDGSDVAFNSNGGGISGASINPIDPLASFPLFSDPIGSLGSITGIYMTASNLGLFPYEVVANNYPFEDTLDLAGFPVPVVVPFSRFANTQVSMRVGEVAFHALVSDVATGTEIQAVYAGDSPQTLRLLADATTSPPGSALTFTTLGRPAIDATGDVVFQGFAGGSVFGIYGDLGVVVDNSTQIPGVPSVNPFVPGFFTSHPFFVPSIDNGAVAFNAHPLSVANGVYVRESNGTLRTVVTGSTPIPDGTGNFVVFDSVQISNGDVAFRGRDGLTSSRTQEGIYADIGGILHTVADLNSPVPDGLGTFIDFSPTTISFDQGNVVFQARGVNGQQGIYTNFGGQLNKIVDNNDQLDGKNISAVLVSEQALSGHQVIFVALFDDGSEGLFMANIGELVPPRFSGRVTNHYFDVDASGWNTTGCASVNNGILTLMDPIAPCSITQAINTPLGSFLLSFQHRLLNGTLNVFIDSELVASIVAPMPQPAGFTRENIFINDPALMGLVGAILHFQLVPIGGSGEVGLDNIGIPIFDLEDRGVTVDVFTYTEYRDPVTSDKRFDSDRVSSVHEILTNVQSSVDPGALVEADAKAAAILNGVQVGTRVFAESPVQEAGISLVSSARASADAIAYYKVTAPGVPEPIDIDMVLKVDGTFEIVGDGYDDPNLPGIFVNFLVRQSEVGWKYVKKDLFAGELRVDTAAGVKSLDDFQTELGLGTLSIIQSDVLDGGKQIIGKHFDISLTKNMEDVIWVEKNEVMSLKEQIKDETVATDLLINGFTNADFSHTASASLSSSTPGVTFELLNSSPQQPIDDLTARAKSEKVGLLWSPVETAASYNIYRKLESEPTFTLIVENHVSDFAGYTDIGLTNGATYQYVVTWITAEGLESPFSNQVSATPTLRIRTR